MFTEYRRCKGEKIKTEVPLSALIYSFGIVIWEILTQQKPYAGRNEFI